MIEATVSTISIWRPTNRRRESAYPPRADIATVIRVIRAEVSRLFHAQRGTRPSVSTLMYACRVNPLSGTKGIGRAAEHGRATCREGQAWSKDAGAGRG